MADFPTTKHTFTPFSNGAGSDAAQVTDIYAEVEAIEDGYLNGTARLNSSNSTVANLSVSGASTFAGAVTFSVPRVRLTHSADSAIADSAFVGLNWDTETFDPNGMHSTSANSSRITFVESTGVYLIGYTVNWNINSSGVTASRAMLNDSTVNVIAASVIPSFAAASGAHSAQGLMRIQSTTDYATVQVFQNSGSTRSVTSTGIYVTTFWAYKVSA